MYPSIAAYPYRAPQWILALVSVLLLTFSVQSLAGFRDSLGAEADTSPSVARVTQAYNELPMRFEANHGQTNREVKFLSRGSGYTLFLTPTEAVLSLSKPARSKPGVTMEKQRPTGAVLRMQLVGANPGPGITGEEAQAGNVRYIMGIDSTNYRTNTRTYSRVRYQGVYPGIDMLYYGNQRQLEYDFVVAPRTDPGVIRLDFEGAERVELDASGDLVLHVAGGQIRQQRPFVYQTVDGRRREIPSRYTLRGGHQVGFDLGSYDKALPLIIDPVVSYSTYLGGNNVDSGMSITVDRMGNAYVAGITYSLNFPTTRGSYDRSTTGGLCGPGVDCTDAFVTKLNAAGSRLVYSTYLGGRDDDVAAGIAVDRDGNAYITGRTKSEDFPTTIGAYDRTYNGLDGDAFVAKLNNAGSELLYSTYLGGGRAQYNPAPFGDGGNDIEVDSGGNAYVTGYANSSNFPTTPGAYDRTYNGDGQDVFVTKLNAAGSKLLYSTYLGGRGESLLGDLGTSLEVDATGNAYVTGATDSPTFPTTAGAYDRTYNGGTSETPDAFITKLSATGSRLVYSTYLGGKAIDEGNDLAVDGYGNVYVTGQTQSSNYPTTRGAYDRSFNGGYNDVFVTKLARGGGSLAYSTYVGGSGGSGVEYGTGIVVDPAGRAYVTGPTASRNYPTTPGGGDRTYNGGEFDAFLTGIDARGSGLSYSRYVGGRGNDQGFGIALHPAPGTQQSRAGVVYITGYTDSTNFPTTTGAYDRSYNGGFSDAFVMKLR